MRRVASAALAGLDALALVAIGLGIPLLAAVGIWGMNFGFSTDFAGFYRSSVVVWLLGHGVDVSVQVDPVLAAQLGVAASEPFRVTAAIGGFAVLSFILAVRAGRRAALSFAPVVALLSLLIVTALCALALTLSAASTTALPSRWQGALMPLGIVAMGALLGGELERRSLGQETWTQRLAASARWSERVSVVLRRDLAAMLRGGVAVAAATIGLASLGLAISTVWHYAAVIQIAQALQTGLGGAIVLLLGQLLLLPNLVLMASSWLAGPGFAIGAGSTVAPGATVLGPIPALPIFGAIPQSGQVSLVVLAIPALASFIIAAVIRSRDDRFISSAKSVVILRVAVGVALLGAGLLAGLAAFLGGAIGPGALSNVGPNPLALFGWAAAEFFLGALLGGYAGRFARRD